MLRANSKMPEPVSFFLYINEEVQIMFPISAHSSSREASTSNSRKPRPNAPSIYGHGHYVGVRINKYETKAEARGRGQGNTGMIHPAVVLAGPDANNRYDIATISTEHPDSPPRAPLNMFHPTTTITGDVSFYKRNVGHGDLRPWIDESTGNITQPMSQSQLTRLRSKIIVQPQLPPNGAYFPVASNTMGNRPWSEESVYPQPVFGQHYIPHSKLPHPVHHHNVHLSSCPPPNGQFYNPSVPQGMTYGYAAPYNLHSGAAPNYTAQDPRYYWYPPLSDERR